jgi:F-type H+-transporting ATP synthase subunit e
VFLQVVRYSALVSGIAYGIFHRRTLQAKFDANAASAELKKREHWLEEAKAAWAKKNAPADGRECHPSAWSRCAEGMGS